jgi:hypothetical protein
MTLTAKPAWCKQVVSATQWLAVASIMIRMAVFVHYYDFRATFSGKLENAWFRVLACRNLVQSKNSSLVASPVLFLYHINQIGTSPFGLFVGFMLKPAHSTLIVALPRSLIFSAKGTHH